MNPRRLYRCRHDRQLAGVAAGMAEHLDLDPTLVRVLWILSAFFGGFTILLYIVLAFVIPLEPATMPAPGSWQAAGPAWGAPPAAADGTEPAGETPAWPAPGPDAGPPVHREGRGGLYLGVALVVFGAIALANAAIPGWAGAAALGPALLVALGVALLVGSTRRGASES